MLKYNTHKANLLLSHVFSFIDINFSAILEWNQLNIYVDIEI